MAKIIAYLDGPGYIHLKPDTNFTEPLLFNLARNIGRHSRICFQWHDGGEDYCGESNLPKKEFTFRVEEERTFILALLDWCAELTRTPNRSSGRSYYVEQGAYMEYPRDGRFPWIGPIAREIEPTTDDDEEEDEEEYEDDEDEEEDEHDEEENEDE